LGLGGVIGQWISFEGMYIFCEGLCNVCEGESLRGESIYERGNLCEGNHCEGNQCEGNQCEGLHRLALGLRPFRAGKGSNERAEYFLRMGVAYRNFIGEGMQSMQGESVRGAAPPRIGIAPFQGWEIVALKGRNIFCGWV
jgi:hypothetical protein